MSKEYASPLRLELTHSKTLKLYLLGLHVIAMFAVLYSAVPVLLHLACAVFILLHLLYQLKRELSVEQLVWFAENDWSLVNRQGEPIQANLTAMTFCSSWLVILALKTETGQRINIPVFFDALDEEVFRRLKVRLTIHAPSYFKKPAEEKR